MTLGTEVSANWDTDLLNELAPVWDGRGYLFDNGPGYMNCVQVADTVVSVLAAPTCLPYVSVLADPAMREGIKQYSQWPTIPQLYVKQEFIGGCDIAREMYESGELQELLKNKGVASKAA